MTAGPATPIPSSRWWRIIPLVMLIFVFSFMDRTNIGFAIAGGMSESLSMSASFSGLAAGIFFVGYVVLQWPGGHIAEHGSAKNFIGLSILAWGGLSVLSGLVENSTQLLIVRFLVGVAEGGVFPATLVLISHWFPNEERGRAIAYYNLSIAIAGIVTGPTSGWIISDFGWRWVFIVEGIVSLLLMLIWFPLIANRPADAKWISVEEREYLEHALRNEQLALKSSIKQISYGALLKDFRLWHLVVLYIFFDTGCYGFAMWLPSILRNLTDTGMKSVGILAIFPYIAVGVGLYVFAQFSDRSLNRRRYTAMPMILFAVTLFLSTFLRDRIWVSYACLVICGLFLQSPNCSFWTIPSLMFPAEMSGGARGIINAFGNLGGFIGPFIVGWFTTLFHNYNAGVYFLALTLLISFLLTWMLPSLTTGKIAYPAEPSYTRAH
jgi:MFS family permease